MNKTTTTTTTQKTMTPNNAGTGIRDYKVSAPTAAILDCITSASDLFDKISQALELKYTIEQAEEVEQKYNDAIWNIIDMLHDEIKGQLIENLGNMNNSHSNTPII